jgi:hypothetical protein
MIGKEDAIWLLIFLLTQTSWAIHPFYNYVTSPSLTVTSLHKNEAPGPGVVARLFDVDLSFLYF